jgi:PAS domain S-box-containing protein
MRGWSPAQVMDISRYAFEVLRRHREHVLYRGQTEDDAAPVLVLSPEGEHLTSESLRRLGHAYSLKEELDSDWAARPIAIARHWDRTVLVMEDPGGLPLDQLLGQRLDLALSLRIAVSLSSAIGHLHGRGIIHKDIKPAHVLAIPNTGRCWLMGFGISSRLPRERQSPEPPESIAGTLAYMAPEQTGRMNRSVDSRSDLYSLGVLLYEMLTGSLPFTATDPMEWVHCHIARQPVPPSQRVEGVPPAISAIVMKLLAKTAEERYQTAIGAEYDLRRCLDAVETGSSSSVIPRTNRSSSLPASIAPFPLGTHDVPDQLRIPEKLYGREHEIETLLDSFHRIVARGKPELVLVSGYSGIGKSSVVNELHKALVPPRGLFVAAKFDKFKRDIPYATLAQAIQNLIQLLLSKNETELDEWRDVLREALGPNGQLMVDLIPELKIIIGEQPQVPILPPQDAQHRFHLVFRRFIGVFSRREHPLALFLDDLQWLDSATLDLFEDVLTQGVGQHLMLIGAYRDNEVTFAHPLIRKLAAIRQTEATVQEIVLAPLTREDLERLITDALRCEPEYVSSLAGLVHEKTSGNPFFAIQFISSLADEHLLRFDHAAGRWSWDLERIRAKGHTDNVVDLMLGKLNRLPVETQKALKAFACLGNMVEISTLAIVHGHVLYSRDDEEPVLRSQTSFAFQATARPQEQSRALAERRPDGEGGMSEEKLHSDLWEALRLEFIVRSEDSYKFVHDRVQEAAYSLIPEELRAEAHLQIGRRLLSHMTPERREGAVFEIVNQLNRGALLISSQEEREQLAELNVVAGKRAKASSAFASALKYLVAGATFLDESAWDRRHELVFTLELSRAECEFLTGQTAVANERLTILASRAIDTVELAAVTCLRIDYYTVHDQTGRAVDVFLDYFRHLGVEWSRHPTAEEGRREYQRIWSQLGTRTIEDLVDLPLMADPASLGTLDVLTKIYVPAVFTDANLLSWTVCYAVNLSLERGNSDASCLAYVWLGKIAGAYFGDHQVGVRFGRLSQELVEKRNLKRFEAQTYLWFAENIAPWTDHIRNCRELIRWAFESATESGEITTASYSFDILTTNLLAAGDPLIEAQRQAEDGIVFSGRSRSGFGRDVISGQLGLIRTLRGLNDEFGHLDDGHYSEAQLERHFADQPARTLPACWYWIRKLQARFFSGDYVSAVDAAEKARPLLWSSPAHFETVEYHFFSALSHAALSDFGPSDEQRQHFELVVAHHRQLENWAKNCPQNFVDRATLVSAELARIEGRIPDAMDLYEQAIRSAQANGFVHNEALANELAARFYVARDFEKIAQAYLRDARYCYLRWGADGKVRQLDELHPQIRQEGTVSGSTSSIDAPLTDLDFDTVMRASRAISSEIVLQKLIRTLMQIAIEHAGAERGLLILPRGSELRISAESTTSGDRILVDLKEAPVNAAALPESIVHYVVRTHETVILDDASGRNAFSEDSYIRRRDARSMLCLPLVNQAKLIGLLYLENNLAAHVFTPKRITVLRLLASQAAISLENTLLYGALEEREAALRRSETYLSEAQRLSQTGSFGWDVESGKIYWSQETFRIFEYDPATKPGLELILQRTHPADRSLVRELIDRVSAERKDFDFEHRLLSPDGSVKYLRVVGHPSTREKSGRFEFIGAVTDITERKRAEKALKEKEASLYKTQSELAHVSRVTTMGELAASIAHEVNQPLVGVVANASAGLRYLDWDTPNLAEAKEAIRAIIRDGNRAAEVISRMRALFKKTHPVKEALNINEAIEEVVLLTQGEARRNKVKLRVEPYTNLALVMADRVQIQQVLMNLILNGIQAMSEVQDRERVLVVRAQSGEGDEIRVAVRDCGIGIAPGDMERIFDAFHTTKPGGMGMGLSISRSIVESHGGRLWATPNDGPGVTFQFTL